MARIDIRRKHGCNLKEARAAVDRVAKAIAKEFNVDYAWDGNTLAFSRGGVDGHIAVAKDDVHVYAELGFLAGAMKPMIESEIVRHLDEQFGRV